MGKQNGKWAAIGLLAGAAVLLRRAGKRQAWHDSQRSGPGWALITGASSGIGEAFARRLARSGYSLVLVARREERLRAIAGQIGAEAAARGQPLEVEVLPADLDQPDGLERVAQRLARDPGVTLLVNNAGFGGGRSFANAPVDKSLSMMRVHMLASVRLAHAALPAMLAQKRGAIINVSSLAGFVPMPGSIPYAATKAFLNNFSEALSIDLAGSGVRVQALCPGLTRSEFHATAGIGVPALPEWAWLTSEQVVEESLRGLSEDRAIVVPGLVNQVIHAFASHAVLSPLVRFGLRFGRKLV